MFLQVALKAGCDCAAVIVTNDFSRKIFENFGMENIKTESWNEFKTADGNLMFQKYAALARIPQIQPQSSDTRIPH